jgi:hypothetical protein
VIPALERFRQKDYKFKVKKKKKKNKLFEANKEQAQNIICLGS